MGKKKKKKTKPKRKNQQIPTKSQYYSELFVRPGTWSRLAGFLGIIAMLVTLGTIFIEMIPFLVPLRVLFFELS